MLQAEGLVKCLNGVGNHPIDSALQLNAAAAISVLAQRYCVMRFFQCAITICFEHRFWLLFVQAALHSLSGPQSCFTAMLGLGAVCEIMLIVTSSFNCCKQLPNFTVISDTSGDRLQLMFLIYLLFTITGLQN